MKGQPSGGSPPGGKMEALLRTLRTLKMWRSQLFKHEACASKPRFCPIPLLCQDENTRDDESSASFHYV